MFKYLLLSLIYLFLSPTSNAELLPFGPTKSEMAYMPEYCKARFSGPQSPEFKLWEGRVGGKNNKTWKGLHHYCAGVNNMNRYLNLFKDPKRNYYLSRAVPEMNYTLNNLPDDFIVAADMYLNRGLAYQLMKKNNEATADFNKSIAIDPKNIQAYLNLASLAEKNNQKQKALTIITTGLTQVPNSNELKNKYLKLGGKEPYPAIEAPSTTEQKPSLDGVLIPNPTGKDIIKDDNSITSLPQELTIQEENTASTNTPGNEEKSDTKIEGAKTGIPTNPYCRFCP